MLLLSPWAWKVPRGGPSESPAAPWQSYKILAKAGRAGFCSFPMVRPCFPGTRHGVLSTPTVIVVVVIILCNSQPPVGYAAGSVSINFTTDGERRCRSVTLLITIIIRRNSKAPIGDAAGSVPLNLQPMEGASADCSRCQQQL